jgi:hypothetical protein
MRELNHLSNRKERTGRLLPSSLRLGLFGQCLYIHAGCLWQARAGTRSGAHPATSGTRKLSVPGRVHSVPKSCGFSEAWWLPEFNPFVTRGTVESPAKCRCAAPSNWSRRADASNQSQGLGRPTPRVAGRRLSKIQCVFIGLMSKFSRSATEGRAAVSNQP